MAEPRYDIYIRHVPADVAASAEAQAKKLSEIFGHSLSVTDMLVGQRRMGEFVLGLFLKGKYIELAYAIYGATDPTTIKRRTKQTETEDDRQLPMFEEEK